MQGFFLLNFMYFANAPHMAQVKSLASFYQQLSYCMAQYVEKVGPKPMLFVDLDGRVTLWQWQDPRLAYDIITSMLRYWPV